MTIQLTKPFHAPTTRHCDATLTVWQGIGANACNLQAALANGTVIAACWEAVATKRYEEPSCTRSAR